MMWKYTGQVRPPFAEAPGPGEESVWDYPRPPALEKVAARVEVYAGERRIAASDIAYRVLETASPPSIYVPAETVDLRAFAPCGHQTFCEWKGVASYYQLATAVDGPLVAWRYDNPVVRFRSIDGAISFYPGRLACFWNGERVTPQPGEFYGGWMTSNIVGPVKGGPGTAGW